LKNFTLCQPKISFLVQILFSFLKIVFWRNQAKEFPVYVIVKFNVVKTIFLILPFLILAAFSCTKDVSQEQIPEIPINDLGKYNMKIIPESPVSGDEVRLVLYQDCRYNKLTSLKRSGTVIDIVKQYNSMIMAPCVLTNDTIQIGKLPAGIYRINYWLVDIAVLPGKTTFSVSFRLPVAR
jgi:hypothetical protein